MLNQFFTDWNAAIQARKVTKETRNKQQVILTQETEFKFRNITVQMFSRIKPGDEHKPEKQRRWISELFVPATNKIIPSTQFASRAKCAAAILACLVEGRDHEDKLQVRAERRKQQVLEDMLKNRREKLEATSFSAEDVDYIMNWISNNTVEGRASWDDVLLEALTKYHMYINPNYDLTNDVNFGPNDKRLHTKRMFDTACALITESFKDRNGIDVLPRKSIARHFLDPKEGIPYGVYVVRSAYSKINDICQYSNKMMHIIKFIADYLAMKLGTTVEEGIKDLKVRRENKFNRKVEREIKGTSNAPRSKASVSAFPTYSGLPVSASLGDLFGDVLDNIQTAPAKQISRKKAHKTSFVTDRQINGKQAMDRHNETQGQNATEEVEVGPHLFTDEELVLADDPTLTAKEVETPVVEEAVEVAEEVAEPVAVAVEAIAEEEPTPKKKKGSKKKSKAEADMDAEDAEVIKKPKRASKRKSAKVDIDDLD